MQKFLSVFFVVFFLIISSPVHLTGADENKNYFSKLPPLIDRELFFGDPEISRIAVIT